MDKHKRIEYLQSKRNQKQSELYASQSLVASINAKLERLEKAKKEVDLIYNQIIPLRKDTYVIRDKEEWKGSKKDEFVNKMEIFNEDFKSYIDEVESYYDQICDAITKLENEKYNQESIIGGLKSFINSIGNELHKLWH